ncbi:MAG TPA: MerR family transcriptional regulator [Burkholderiaceae bacterium]|nr:MerR family transcriptional regulator [Burkholderiaceae bacterium]
MNLRVPITLSIAAVERDTGLSKDTLRVWERRYGFPNPQRDASGERAYPLEQVEKLRVIKRLMDAGHRPGRIVATSIEDLQRLSDSSAALAPRASLTSVAPELGSYLALVRSHDLDAVHRQLAGTLMRLGLGRFITEVVSPLNRLIGDAWMHGQLEVFEEHLYTEAMQVVLRNAISALPAEASPGVPRVLLTTFPHESHGLGLLMAQGMLMLEGCRCVSLGVQTPLWDIVLAATGMRCDVVALSFSSAPVPGQVVEALAELRSKLPASTSLWAGGTAPVLHRRPTPGVLAVDDLGRVPELVAQWRARHAPSPVAG